MSAKIRKIATFLEETRTEMGRVVDPPTRRAAAVAVIENKAREINRTAGLSVSSVTNVARVREAIAKDNELGKDRRSLS